MNTELNYYFPIIIAAALVSVVWMYIAMKRAPELEDEEDKSLTITFNVNIDDSKVVELDQVKPKRVYRKKAKPTVAVKRTVGRPRKATV